MPTTAFRRLTYAAMQFLRCLSSPFTASMKTLVPGNPGGLIPLMWLTCQAIPLWIWEPPGPELRLGGFNTAASGCAAAPRRSPPRRRGAHRVCLRGGSRRPLGGRHIRTVAGRSAPLEFPRRGWPADRRPGGGAGFKQQGGRGQRSLAFDGRRDGYQLLGLLWQESAALIGSVPAKIPVARWQRRRRAPQPDCHGTVCSGFQERKLLLMSHFFR